MRPETPVSLKDIASVVGVSVMTVSRAMRGNRNVAPATRARIRRVAADLGYRPNPLVSALMAFRHRNKALSHRVTLGFLTAFNDEHGWRMTRINRDFHRGAERHAARHGYCLETFWLRAPGMTAKRMGEILINRNIRGLMVAPLPVGLGHLRFDWDSFASVTIGYSLAKPELHRVVNHQFRSMLQVMRRLRRFGYRRAGLALRSSIDERVSHHWTGGFLTAQRRFSNAVPVEPLILRDREWNREAFLRWIAAEQPEVVISQHEEIIEWLESSGVRVPGDVGFVHLDCPDQSGSFAGIYQNAETVGVAAIDFLIGMIHRNELGIPSPAHAVLVEGSWQDGDSLRKRAWGLEP